ncbi:MAG: addiction module protein [Myxococcales bacterium]|nr:addiction module protein [Myxococcales bacterium]
MVARPRQLDELLKLPADARAAAAEELLRSLEGEAPDEVDVRQAWAAELERRIREPSPGIPAEGVLDEGRRRLRDQS